MASLPVWERAASPVELHDWLSAFPPATDATAVWVVLRDSRQGGCDTNCVPQFFWKVTSRTYVTTCAQLADRKRVARPQRLQCSLGGPARPNIRRDSCAHWSWPQKASRCFQSEQDRQHPTRCEEACAPSLVREMLLARCMCRGSL